MSADLLPALLTKMAAAAAIVASASVLAEKSKPFIAAMIATLPISAGPAMLFLALEHGDAFMAVSLHSSMTTNIATAGFSFVYVLLAQRLTTIPALGMALGFWTIGSLLLNRMELSFVQALAGNVLAYALLIPLVSRFMTAEARSVPARLWYAIPLRAALVALLVAVVTGLSFSVGPGLTGLLTVFPIVLSSLILILQPRIGGAPMAAIIANGMPGLLGFGLSAGLAVASVDVVGRYWALALGLLASFVWNGMLIGLRRWRS